jgi:hypothetical protein
MAVSRFESVPTGGRLAHRVATSATTSAASLEVSGLLGPQPTAGSSGNWAQQQQQQQQQMVYQYHHQPQLQDHLTQQPYGTGQPLTMAAQTGGHLTPAVHGPASSIAAPGYYYVVNNQPGGPGMPAYPHTTACPQDVPVPPAAAAVLQQYPQQRYVGSSSSTTLIGGSPPSSTEHNTLVAVGASSAAPGTGYMPTPLSLAAAMPGVDLSVGGNTANMLLLLQQNAVAQQQQQQQWVAAATAPAAPHGVNFYWPDSK